MPVSRHALSRRLAITGLLSVGLSACAQSEATVSPFAEPTRADASALGKEPELLVVTTRRSLGARQPYFGSDRGSLTFAEVRLSPPGRGISGYDHFYRDGDNPIARVEPVIASAVIAQPRAYRGEPIFASRSPTP